jgi:hypothetical protein
MNAKPLKKMKTLASVILFSSIGLSCVQSQTIYLEDFNSYNSDNLSGQNSWSALLGNSSRIFSNTTATQALPAIVPASNFAGNSTATSGLNSGAIKTISMSLGGATAASFSVDLFRSGPSPAFGAGFGSSTGLGGFEGVSILQQNSNIYFRSGVASGANPMLMTDSLGNSIQTANNTWNRVTFNLDFASNTITSAFIENLSIGSPSTQIYFGAGNQSMSYSFDESTWNRIAIRSGIAGSNEVGIDNIRLTATSAIPEPSTYASIAGLMIGVFAAMRRRRISA